MSFFDRFRKKKVEDPKAAPAAKEAAKPAKEAKPAAKAAAAPAAKPAGANAKPEGGNLMAAADLGALLPGAPPGGKINLAIYWAAACGGCDVSILDTNERILTVGDMANIVMWPIAQDGKEKDIAAMKDQEITVCIVSGAIRNSENEHMVKLLRQKSLLMVSYGSCACFGGSPALANLVPGGSKVILDYVYTKAASTATFQADYHKDKPVVPLTSYQAPEGELTLPVIYDTVKTLDQTVDVDYYVPGCPPQIETITHMLAAVAGLVYAGVALPPRGTTIGVTNMSLCDQCHRRKEFRRITDIKEPYQVNVDPDLCLMDQGILCLGPATVGGCNARCTKVGQPCRGCYGPTTEVQEHGASALTAIASLFPILDEDATMGEDIVVDIMSKIKDPLGYFYAFTMSKSLIKRAVSEKGGQ
ncbi:MAG: oxidoreductase [Candidatus Methanomethylophilaceae archaeon]|nr:oxidoreductase [Candidatus Methanomethylophilaceae archaeon]